MNVTNSLAHRLRARLALVRTAIAAVAVVTISATRAPAQTYEFDHSYTSVFAANAMNHVVGTTNVQRTNEGGNVTYWHPVANGVDSSVRYKFEFAAPVSEGVLYVKLASYNHSGTSGWSSLWGSVDGLAWSQLADCPVPSGSVDRYVTFDAALPNALLGTREIHLDVRMRTSGWNIQAQHSRSGALDKRQLRLAANFTNRALQLDGTSWVRVADAPGLDLQEQLTIEGWVKPNHAGGAIVEKWADLGVHQRSYSVEMTPGGALQFGLSRTNNQLDAGFHAFESGSVPVGVWSHFAVTYDGSWRRTYLNGDLVASRATSGLVHAGSATLSLGAHLRSELADATNHMAGLLDEVRIWSSARSRTEIRELMLHRIAPSEAVNRPSLVACWSFDQSVTDSTGVHHGTVVGTEQYAIANDLSSLVDCDEDGTVDALQIENGPNLDLNQNGVLDTCECVVEVYCVGAPNSVGPGARIALAGTTSLAQNDMTLVVTGCPPNTSGMFFAGPSETQMAFGNGVRCVSGAIHRLGIAPANASGVAARYVDNQNLPSGLTLTAGSTIRMQYWYRNPAAGGAGFNLSDAVRARFCP